MYPVVYESQSENCGSHFSLSTVWVLVIKIRSSGLVAGIFNLQAVALAFKVKVFYLWSLHLVGERQKIS